MKTGAFTLHRIDGYICNIYLVEYPDRLLLFDSGSINDIPRIESACAAIGRHPSEIGLVMVSHMHPDHAGGAVALRKKYGLPVAAFREVDRWYAGVGGWLQHKLDSLMAQSVALRSKRHLRKILYERIIRPDYKLSDGDTLPGFPDWRALHVPGHTLHDIALYHESSQTLYSADCVLEVNGKLQLPLPVMFPDRMRLSYDRLAALNPKTLLLGHGDPIDMAERPDIFAVMKEKLDQPPTWLAKRIHLLSIYSHELMLNPSRRKLWHWHPDQHHPAGY
ncbi:MAG: MBL fold metallo-hydrolase [Solirubrobacterales bacterium]